MADNLSVTAGAATYSAATDKVTYSGDAAQDMQVVHIAGVTGAEGSKTVVEVVGPAGTAAAGVVSVQGIASMTPILATVTNSGTFVVQNTSARAATATLANVSGSASNVTLQASNASRRMLIVMNDSTAILYVKYGATATSTSYTYKLEAGESLREDMYTGIVDGIWASATGAARMTELT